jgi:hypothetical protein
MSSVLLLASTYLTNLLTRRAVKMDEIDVLVKKAHEYSGLDPDSFYAFTTNITLFKKHIGTPENATPFLYIALEHLEDVGIMSEFQEDIHELVKQIGYYAEQQLMNVDAAFHPKYLNSRL